MHSPYQHSYAGNTPYPQAPGNSYAPGSNFPPASYTSAASAAVMKYAMPQYKPGVSSGNVSHVAGGATAYGNFGSSPSNFTTINSSVNSATASGYDDVSGPQYKDNNLFIPSPQVGKCYPQMSLYKTQKQISFELCTRTLPLF
jgi:hypothetical protein